MHVWNLHYFTQKEKVAALRISDIFSTCRYYSQFTTAMHLKSPGWDFGHFQHIIPFTIALHLKTLAPSLKKCSSWDAGRLWHWGRLGFGSTTLSLTQFTYVHFELYGVEDSSYKLYHPREGTMCCHWLTSCDTNMPSLNISGLQLYIKVSIYTCSMQWSEIINVSYHVDY